MAVIPLNAGAKLLPDGTQATGARFSVERVLSAGGFGITYLARDEQFDDTCVVKELAMGELVGRDTTGGTLQPLPGRQADVAYWVDKVVREARLLNRVRHEAVVTVRAAWQERGTAYYAMDHIDGMEFPSRQTEGWTWNHCEPLFRRMLEGLQAIHAAGLVHSDIKPSNILVKRNGQPVFIDFGTARTGEEMGKTKLTTVAFTPGYAPPELESKDRGKEVGPWSDLYSLAMVFIGMFVTHPGLEGNPLESRMRETLARHAVGADPYNAGLRATMVSNGMSPPWADLLMACISVEPAGRPQSVADFFSRLDTAPRPAAPFVAPVDDVLSKFVTPPHSSGLDAPQRPVSNSSSAVGAGAAPAYQPPVPRRGAEEASFAELVPARFAAHVVDAVLAVVSLVPAGLVMAIGPHKEVETYYGTFDGGPSAGTVFVAVIAGLFGFGYFVVKQFEAISHGQTIGKRVAGIQVRMKDGRVASGGTMVWRGLSLMLVFGILTIMQNEGSSSEREFAAGLSAILSILNICMYLFNRGRGLQDVIAGTYVSKKD
jgi:serine/threonine protein kinase/uncharacterized RDD family membrane protein YckC